MKPKQKKTKIYRRGPINRGKVLLKERLQKDLVSVVRLPSCNVLAKHRKQLDGCLDHIHSSFDTGRRRILPESMNHIINQDVYQDLEQRIKELSPSTQGGLVYLALSLRTSLNLGVTMKQPDDVTFDTCIILPRGAPMILSVVRDKTRPNDACSKYNLSITKALIQALRQFTNESFSALYGVLTTKDLSTPENFQKAYERIEENSSFFCIPESLSMSDRKYEGITKAFMAVAASTDVVQMMCADDDADERKEQLWYLTKEQFAVLSENIDRKTVTVLASPGSGATVLMLEVASRLEKSGKTLLVSSSDDLCKKARKKKLCSHIMTRDKFVTHRESPRSYPLARVKHVVCDGRWSLGSTKVSRLWNFVRNSDTTPSVHFADTASGSTYKSGNSNDRQTVEHQGSILDTPPCTPIGVA